MAIFCCKWQNIDTQSIHLVTLHATQQQKHFYPFFSFVSRVPFFSTSLCPLKLYAMWPDVTFKNGPIAAKSGQKRFDSRSDDFQNNLKVTKYLGNVCEKICAQELSKIAQTCHTDSMQVCSTWRLIRTYFCIPTYGLHCIFN